MARMLPNRLGKRLLLEYLKVDEGVLGQVLNHALQTVTRKHYAASNSVDDKRTALLKWDRYLAGLVHGRDVDNVVEFPGAA